MLSGHADAGGSFHQRSDSGCEIPSDLISDSDEDPLLVGKVVYRASFSELKESNLKYDTIIWVLISLLLVMAWGVGLLMLLYLPFKRYVLREEISSRMLYVTEDSVVYKARRPSFIPFWGPVKIKKQVPLHLVIDIIIEQGCLQAAYGLHTVRIDSRVHGKPAPVDVLQFQGVTKPNHLRRIIVAEATKSIKHMAIKPIIALPSIEGQLSTPRMRSHSDIPTFNKIISSPSAKVRTPRHGPYEVEVALPASLLLHKLEEINQSAKKIESLVVGSHSEAAAIDS